MLFQYQGQKKKDCLGQLTALLEELHKQAWGPLKQLPSRMPAWPTKTSAAAAGIAVAESQGPLPPPLPSKLIGHSALFFKLPISKYSFKWVYLTERAWVKFWAIWILDCPSGEIGIRRLEIQKVISSQKKYKKVHYNMLLSCSVSTCPYSTLKLMNSTWTITIKFSWGTQCKYSSVSSKRE